MWGRKKSSRGETNLDTDGSKSDTATISKQPVKNKNNQELLPNKELEECVLSYCSEYLASNLPAGDVAPVMFAKNLLSRTESEEFQTMKRSGRITTTSMSEYLLECLRKRRAGFLKAFCSILQEIEPAKYLVDYIHKAYREVEPSYHSGFMAKSGDTLSIRSRSDTDLRQKTPITCENCKKMEEKIKHLKKQMADYDRERTKVDVKIEIIQDQLKRELTETQKLKRIVPHLYDAISLIDRVSSPQQTLHQISDLMNERSKCDRRFFQQFNRTSVRDSILSTSSVAGSFLSLHMPDEDRYHSTDSTSHAEQSRSSAKPATQKRDVENTVAAQTPLHNQSESGSRDKLPFQHRARSGSLGVTMTKQAKPSLKTPHTLGGRSKSFSKSKTDKKDSFSGGNDFLRVLSEKVDIRRKQIEKDNDSIPSQSQ